MNSTRSLFLMAAFLAAACGTSENQTSTASEPPDEGKITTWKSAVKLNAEGLPQTCTGPTDPTCNGEGPGQRLTCDADLLCRLYWADDNCEYPGLEGGPMSCKYSACTNDEECNDGRNDTSDTCIFTESSFVSDVPGVCFFAYASCTALEGTPCEEHGVTYCADGECTCTVDGDQSKAQTETCDGQDDDCDGNTDEDFPELGDSCDGADSDQCTNGTFTCTLDQLATECVNETPMDVTEMCDASDNDCDGVVDEDFPTLEDPCDGDDADLCQNGSLVCTLDGSGVTCTEVDLNVTEVCNGADDDCDGATDESCDDDGDDWCDAAMTVMAGASCDAGDCDDEDDEVHPEAVELCDGVDNDCDDLADEDFNLGGACSDGLGVCMVEGTFVECSEDGMSAVCSATADMSQQLDAEVCNGQDDTCDGATDEGCDDDGDGFCDEAMVTGVGAACHSGDCNDTDAAVNANATELCNEQDDTCDGATDEGCDDDADGFCDEAMTVEAGATCDAGDCDDTSAEINPGKEEQCITAADDNCDGLTDVLADGVTPACDSCANVLTLPCDEDVEINMAEEPNAANAIEIYHCWLPKANDDKMISVSLSASEVIVKPDAEAGTTFSLQITTPGTGTVAALLHGSCEPDEGTSVVSPYHPPEHNGTCANYSVSMVPNGVAGEDYVSLDAVSNQTVTVHFFCD